MHDLSFAKEGKLPYITYYVSNEIYQKGTDVFSFKLQSLKNILYSSL